jgi:RNA-binding protein with serine-rich domain 1
MAAPGLPLDEVEWEWNFKLPPPPSVVSGEALEKVRKMMFMEQRLRALHDHLSGADNPPGTVTVVCTAADIFGGPPTNPNQNNMESPSQEYDRNPRDDASPPRDPRNGIRNRSYSRDHSRDRDRSGSRDDRAYSRDDRESRGRTRSRSPSRRSQDYSSDQRTTKVPTPAAATASTSASPSNTRTQIIIEKLTKNITESHLREIFSRFGAISSLDLPLHRTFNHNRGTAYIVYASAASATEAFVKMHEGWIDGVQVDVRIVQTGGSSASPRRYREREQPEYGRRTDTYYGAGYGRERNPPQRRGYERDSRSRSPPRRGGYGGRRSYGGYGRDEYERRRYD